MSLHIENLQKQAIYESYDLITNSYQQEDVDKQAENAIEADDELFDLHEDQYVDLEDGDNGILCVL